MPCWKEYLHFQIIHKGKCENLEPEPSIEKQRTGTGKVHRLMHFGVHCQFLESVSNVQAQESCIR
jgi:hypothetical protein